jgi:cytochrome c oxidase cbb3-type subunit 3
MTESWSYFVMALVLINVVGVLWLLWWMRRRKQEASTTGHVWDDDLTEYNNPLPRWWLWLFFATVVFAVAYLVLYPGFGNYAGRLGWSQVGQHEQQVAAAQRAWAERFARFDGMDVVTLSRDPDAMSAARSLFGNNCATCHGSDARGATGFPNLTDADWLHGGDPDTIELTIREGRTGVMPPMGAALGASGVEEVIAYVLSLSGTKGLADMAAAGRPKFEMYCSACHGPDGRGNMQVGAPNLADRVWLHGDSPEFIRQTIMNGRMNRMPGHLGPLGAQKVRLLAAYVYSLSPHPETDDRAAASE